MVLISIIMSFLIFTMRNEVWKNPCVLSHLFDGKKGKDIIGFP